MATTILVDENVVIPTTIQSLAGFRAWTTSDAFPDRGRIDYLQGCMEVDKSVVKDTQRLPKRYFAAGVTEYWLADARAEPLVFQIHRRGPTEYEPVTPDPDGYQHSAVLNRRFRLIRRRNSKGRVTFRLEGRMA